MGLNYGLILSAWGFAGLIGPILIARAKDLTGSFSGMLPLIASVLSASVILPYLTKKPASCSRPAAKTQRSSTLPVPCSRTVPVRNFVKP
jgi:hypothetical protein